MTALKIRQSKVTQTRAPIGANQDVLRLDVSVDKWLFSMVQVVERGGDIVKPVEAACPGEEGEFGASVHDLVEAASSGEFHDDTRR